MPPTRMIKIISYIVIAFFYMKAITGGLLFYAFSTGTKAYVMAADLIDLDENLHCFTLPSSSRDIKISVVSQCTECRCTAGISWLFII